MKRRIGAALGMPVRELFPPSATPALLLPIGAPEAAFRNGGTARDPGVAAGGPVGTGRARDEWA